VAGLRRDRRSGRHRRAGGSDDTNELVARMHRCHRRRDARVAVQPLNAASLIRQHERHDGATRARTSGATRAMQVVLGVVGRVVVHDEVDVVHVNATRRDVGRDQHARMPSGETCEGTLARVLREVTVDRSSRSAELGQLLGQPISAAFCADEHQRAARSGGDLSRDRDLVALLEQEHVMIHRVDG
jgi:hypothetical protein